MKSSAHNMVITGVGPVTPIGIGFAEFAQALAAGHSAIAEVTGFDVETCRSKLAAEIIDFDIKDFLTSEKGYLDRNSALAFAAMRLALEDAALAAPPEAAHTLGLCLGTCFGNTDTARGFYQRIIEKGPRLAPPFIFPHTYNNTTASLLAIEHGIKGIHANFSSGSAAGAEAAAYAVQNLRFGRTGGMFAGGVDALSLPVFAALDAAGRLRASADPAAGRGFVLGEGACVLVLETEAHARNRCARVRATVAGIGVGGEPQTAVTAALADADLSPRDIGLVVCAANGSAADSAESGTLSKLFERQHVKMCVLKSAIGETMGASGPLGLAAAIALLSGAETGQYAIVNAVEPETLAITFVLRI